MGRINAGSLRHRADFLLNGTSVDDGQGGHLEGTSDTALSRACLVEALKGTQALRLGQEINGTPYQITARYHEQVARANRVAWKDKTLKILSVVPATDTEYLTLYALDSGQ